MSATIFCSFDHQDLADLALGQVRRIRGVSGIQYMIGQNTEKHAYNHGAVASVGLFPHAYDSNPSPPGSVNIRITCSEPVKKKVVSLLINLHAQRIVSLP